MPLSHKNLIQLLQHLGHRLPNVESGVCYALAMMGMQAILAKDFATFKKRLDALDSLFSTLPIDGFAEYLQYLEKKRASHKILDARETALVDSRAFFDGLAMYFSPSSFTHLFEKNSAPYMQSTERMFSRVLPYQLVKKMKSDDKKESEVGTVKKVSSFIGSYTSDEMANTLRWLSLSSEKFDPPPTFLMSSQDHVILVSYDNKKQCWTIIDAEHLPVIECSQSELSQEIVKLFCVKNNIVLNTEMYTVDHQVEATNKWFHEKTQHEAWKKIHDQKKITNENVKECLLIAINGRRADTVKMLLESKELTFNVNQALSKGVLPLYLAVAKQSKAIVSLLLDAKADPNLANESGHTAAFMAVESGSMGMLELLLNYKHPKVDFTKIDKFGALPFHHAVQKGRLDMVNTLLTHKNAKTDPNRVLLDGKTALHIAVQNNDADMVGLLLAHKKPVVDVDPLDHRGITPFYLAVQRGYLPIVTSLLARGADIDFPIIASADVLLKAAESKNRLAALTQLFQEKGLGEAKLLSSFTPLHAAVFFGHEDVVKRLVESGADLSKKMQGGISALELAQTMNIPTIVQLLKEAVAEKKESSEVDPHAEGPQYKKRKH